jgi:hypothetical protein
MCSKPAVSIVTRAVTAAATMGTSELARLAPAKTVVGSLARAPETLATATTTALGITKPEVPVIPPPSPTPEEGEPPPTPGQNAPGVTGVEGILAKRRRKLTALQSGLLSTIATSPLGLSGGATVSTPTAGGLKEKLGV